MATKPGKVETYKTKSDMKKHEGMETPKQMKQEKKMGVIDKVDRSMTKSKTVMK